MLFPLEHELQGYEGQVRVFSQGLGPGAYGTGGAKSWFPGLVFYHRTPALATSGVVRGQAGPVPVLGVSDHWPFHIQLLSRTKAWRHRRGILVHIL